MTSLARQFLVILVLAAAGGGGWWMLSGTADVANGAAAPMVPPVPVEVAEARLGEIAEMVEAVGTTRARQSIAVVANVSGRVSEILFQAGQRVEEGYPLVRLDSALEEANLAEARALAEDAQSQLERARQLAANRTVPQARVDELHAQALATRARVAAAERRLADRVVVAPFGGVVGLREVDVGTRINDETTLTRLDDLSVVELEFQVPELFFGRIRRGQQVEANSAAVPGSFVGDIVAIDTRIDPVARAFRVRAQLPNPQDALPAGLFMVARITLATRLDAVLVPEQSVVAEGRSTYVYRVRDNRAERVEVRLGARRVGEVEIVSGIAPGDLIVTAGLQRLRPGAPVRLPERHPQATSGSLTADGVSG